ncbi:response regulator [Fibrella sp. ES10-3-2-2]|nr:histidine kinase [Fibrella sp. ES10-3-2-2]
MSITAPIVCIEDDEDDQHLLKLVFKDLQIERELLFFDNGETALEYLIHTEQKPSLILCDVNLPIINGVELRKQLNSNEALRKKSIPFLFFSTSADLRLVRTAYELTVQGFFRKANSYASLKRQIGLILDYWNDCIHPDSEL